MAAARVLLLLCTCLIASGWTYSLVDSVAEYFDKAKEAVCHQVDRKLADIAACERYRDTEISQAKAAYLSAQAKLAKIYEEAKDGIGSASYETMHLLEGAIEQWNDYVEKAERLSIDVYEKAVAGLNAAADEARRIAEEVFEGKEPTEPFDNRDQVQDAYEHATEAAAKGIEKAFEKVSELTKGSAPPLDDETLTAETSYEKASAAFGDVRGDSTPEETLERASDAADHLHPTTEHPTIRP